MTEPSKTPLPAFDDIPTPRVDNVAWEVRDLAKQLERETVVWKDLVIAKEKEITRLRDGLSETPSFSLEQRTAETLDAERYRYLRSVAGNWSGDECGPMVWSGCGDNFDCLRGEEVDSEVDEAMAEWKAAGSPT